MGNKDRRANLEREYFHQINILEQSCKPYTKSVSHIEVG